MTGLRDKYKELDYDSASEVKGRHWTPIAIFCVVDYIICIIHVIYVISIIYRPAYHGVCCLCLAAGKGQGGRKSTISFVLIFIKVRFYACFYALFWLDLFVLQEQKQGLRRRMAENSVRLTLSICNIELC